MIRRPVRLLINHSHPSTSPGRVTQGFLGTFSWERSGFVRKVNGIWRGKRTWFLRSTKMARVHLAMDFAGPEGMAILACHDGRIVAQFVDTDGARVIYQQIRVGRIFKITAAYWHLQAGSFTHKVGDFVKAGTVIAKMGMTGKATGPHLHFELWRSLRGLSLRSLFSLSMRYDPAYFFSHDLTEIAP